MVTAIAILFPFIIYLSFFNSDTNDNSYVLNPGQQVPTNPNRQVMNRDYLDLAFSSISEEDIYGGISLVVRPNREDNAVVEYIDDYFSHIVLETPQETLNVIVGNESLYSLDFILKVFYNYQEVKFRVLEADEYDTEFLFSLDGTYEVNIPIQLEEILEANDTINKLTVGIFISPDQFAMNDEYLVEQYGLVLNFEINYGSNGELILAVDSTEPHKQIEELMFHSLMINQDFDPSAEAAFHPPNPWQVAPGEEIEMAFVANASSLIPEPLDNYLIISMLDWHQISMNGEPYLLIDVEDGNRNVGQHGRFFIEAPHEPGFYEFVAFLVPNPTRPNSLDNFFPLETAFRFTLEVVE